MLAKSNFKHNSALPLADEIINGQGCGEVSRFKYGLFHMSYNGCEIISVYNLLRLIGRPARLADIAREIYPYGSILMGLFGTNTFLLGKYLKKHGVPYKRITNYDKFVPEFEKTQYCIMSFWTGAICASSLHTITLENRGGKVIVYNRYNNRDFPYEFDNVRDFIKKSKFILAYIYEGGEQGG